MDRLTQSLWRGVEELVPSVAEGTSAVFNLPMLLGAPQPPKPDNRIYCDRHLMVTSTSFMHGNRVCMAAENVEVGAGHSKMLRARWSKSSGQRWVIEHRRGSFGYAQDRLFDSAPQALCHPIHL